MAKGEDPEAIAIYQALMDEVDQAFMARDPERHAQCVYVPHHIRSRQEVINIRTREEMRAAFFRYVEFTEGLGASLHKRKVITARFRNRDAIEGTHEVNTMDADGTHVTPPTRTKIMIMRMQGKWQICGSDNSTEQTTGVSAHLRDLTKPNPVPQGRTRRTSRNMTGETS